MRRPVRCNDGQVQRQPGGRHPIGSSILFLRAGGAHGVIPVDALQNRPL
jgi:hypothetical protein